MFQEEEEQDQGLELDDEEITEEDVLLYSTYPGQRIFILNGQGMINIDEFTKEVSPLNILGVILDESDDSFLVGLPARMSEENGEIKITPFAPVPYIRMIKSGILTLMYTFGSIEKAYTAYLETKGRELYPEIGEYIEEGELEEEPAETAIIDINDTDVSLSKDAAPGQQVQGMTDEELKEYLTKKNNNGELSIGNGKKH